MSDSREESPDWLRSFQAPPCSTLAISSDSGDSPNGSLSKEDSVDSKESSEHVSLRLSDKNKLQDIVPSGSEKSPFNEVPKLKPPKKSSNVEVHGPSRNKKVSGRKRKNGDGGVAIVSEDVQAEKHMEIHGIEHSVWALSSDTESCPDEIHTRGGHLQCAHSPKHQISQIQEKLKNVHADFISINGEAPSRNTLKGKSPKKRSNLEGKPLKENQMNNNSTRKGTGVEFEVAEEASEKHAELRISQSRLPLVLSDKVHRSKALVECEGESIDLSGDMGAVGRIVISDSPSENHDMYFDLKGTIYKTAIVPSRTFCVVSFGQSEAKIEAIMNDFIQLKPQSNVYDAETMVEGTLDGFSFDSEDEGEKVPKFTTDQTDQNEGIEEQTIGKKKGKTEKASGAARKKGKSAGGKPQPQKKARKKTQVPKRAKTKK